MWRALSLYWAFCKYRNVQFWSCSSKVFYCCLLTRLKSIVNFASLPQISAEFSSLTTHSKRYLVGTEKKVWGSWHVTLTSAQKLWTNVVKFDQFDKKKPKASVNADFAHFGIFWQLFASFWHLSIKWSLCQFNAIFFHTRFIHTLKKDYKPV